MSLIKFALTAALLSFEHSSLVEAQKQPRRDNASYFKDNKGQMHLRLDKDNKFRIMQLTDLHFAEDRNRDLQTINMIKEIIRKEDPDFIAITGDLVSGQMYDYSEEESGFWVHYYNEFFQVMNNYDIPWGFVPGFHDYETNLTDDQMQALIQKNEHSASKTNDFKFLNKKLNHGFNYYVPIEVDNGKNGQEVGRIWFFGTGRWNCIGQIGRDCVGRDQIEWYKKESRDIDSSNIFRKNGIAFMHTPLQEHLYMVNSVPVHGQRRDHTECQAMNTGLFGEIVQQQTIQWVSVGLDHSTDYWGTYGGVGLSYGRKTGYGSYGPKFEKRGARMFDLTFDLKSGKMNIDTWIREEDGLIDNQEQWVPPQTFSWLKSPFCNGSEKMTKEQYNVFYNPNGPFVPI